MLITDEKGIGRYMEGSDHSLTKLVPEYFLGGTEENHSKPQSRSLTNEST
jgi:hypothetical protein